MTDEERQNTTRWYRVVGRFFTAMVGTDDRGVITTASPVLRNFRGKHLFQLRRWKQVKKIERVAEEPKED